MNILKRGVQVVQNNNEPITTEDVPLLAKYLNDNGLYNAALIGLTFCAQLKLTIGEVMETLSGNP
jgi:hypothetical protein